MPKGPTAADSASWGGGIFHKRLHLLKTCVAASHHGCSQVEHGNSLHSRGLLVMCHLDTAPGLRTNLASTTLCLGTQPPSASFCSSRMSTPGRRTAQWVKDCCVSLTPECGSLEPTQKPKWGQDCSTGGRQAGPWGFWPASLADGHLQVQRETLSQKTR